MASIWPDPKRQEFFWQTKHGRLRGVPRELIQTEEGAAKVRELLKSLQPVA